MDGGGDTGGGAHHAPPRLSISGEHGFPSDDRIASCVRVFVDGDLLRSVIAYDVIDGWVDVIACDDRGKALECKGQWVTRRVHGDVRAIMPGDFNERTR